MKYYFIISILLLPVSYVFGQDVYQLTFDELIERGLQNSVSIQASVVKAQISQDKAGLARNKRLPDITAGATVGFVGTPVVLDKDFSFMKHPETPDWKQNYQVSATQPIYQGGRIENSIEKADLEQEVAQLSLQKDKSELKLWLVNKYLSLFNLYKRKDVYRKNIEEAKIRLHDIENMKEQGMITTNDVLRSQLVLTNYELADTETNNDIALLSQQLAVILGMDESIILKPDTVFLMHQFNLKSESEYVYEAYSQYPDIKISNVNIALAQNNLKLTKADLLPSLSLQASNTLARPIPNVSPAQDFYLNGWGITLNLSYHISAWFDKKHNVGAAKRQIYLQELAQEQQKQNVRVNVRSAFVKHREAQNRVAVLEKSVEQSNENYRIVKNKYFNQLAILTDLLDANSVQLDAELQLTVAKTNAIYTYYELQKISGNL